MLACPQGLELNDMMQTSYPDLNHHNYMLNHKPYLILVLTWTLKPRLNPDSPLTSEE